LAWELDQYTAHTDLNDLEKIASIFWKKWRAANGLPEFDEPFLEYAPSYPAHRHLYGDEND
jgi:hypothetical protein